MSINVFRAPAVARFRLVTVPALPWLPPLTEVVLDQGRLDQLSLLARERGRRIPGLSAERLALSGLAGIEWAGWLALSGLADIH